VKFDEAKDMRILELNLGYISLGIGAYTMLLAIYAL